MGENLQKLTKTSTKDAIDNASDLATSGSIPAK